MEKGVKRLLEVKTLSEILPKGTVGGKEFARIVDLLLIHEANRDGKKITIFNDAAGDYNGLDSFEGDVFRKEGTKGYQYKFFPSSLSPQHRTEIIKALTKVKEKQNELKLTKWILITPEDFMESATKKDGGDVTWFERLRGKLNLDFELEHWGHTRLQMLFLQTPSLCLYYYPENVLNGIQRKSTIKEVRKIYDKNIITLNHNIEFVGMSVYKQEASKGIPMQNIYIPLNVVPETVNRHDEQVQRINPLDLLQPGSCSVILGDPGSGKSTLLRFLALSGIAKPLQVRYKTKKDDRLPIFVTLRRYADELKTRFNYSLLEFILDNTKADFSLQNADISFFDYYLDSGQSILLFDGLDELPNEHYKEIVKNRINTLISTYPSNTVIVTSRIVGYDSPFRFDDKEFFHFRLTKLQLPEMEQFVEDWYSARVENVIERGQNISDLIRILRDNNMVAIRELAENPLLLTIVALVHRIDAVLPDERIVLYQKCTETLLNTWHTWKFRSREGKNTGQVERRNRRRMQAIAYWIHCRSISSGKDQRAIVPHDDLKDFLTEYITKTERYIDYNNDPEDLAEEFLEFVKKRAGLLIEVGDKKFSFVHLTFQEYLTATYLITDSERDGIPRLWNEIEPFCNDPRWNEVVRLLIADLKSDESQDYIIEHILTLDNSVTSSLLLGGILNDGVEAAIAHIDNILDLMLMAASQECSREVHRPILSLIRNWQDKDESNSRILEKRLLNLFCNAEYNTRILILLNAYSLIVDESVILQLSNMLFDVASRDRSLFYLFFAKQAEIVDIEPIRSNIEKLWKYHDFLILHSPWFNFIAAAMSSLYFSLSEQEKARRSFEVQLVSMSNNEMIGPYVDYNHNCLRISNKLDLLDSINFNKKLKQKFRKRTKGLDYLTKIRSQNKAINSSVLAEIRIAKYKGDIKKFDEKSSNKEFSRKSRNIIESSNYQDLFIKIICEIFELKPEAHWWEALKTHFIPNIPYRVPIVDQKTIEKYIQNIREGKVDQTTIFSIAWILLFDTWNENCGSQRYKLLDVQVISDLSKYIDHPSLRIAHCIRDVVYGDVSKIKDLEDIIKSKEPNIDALLVNALWKASEEEFKIIKELEENNELEENKERNSNKVIDNN